MIETFIVLAVLYLLVFLYGCFIGRLIEKAKKNKQESPSAYIVISLNESAQMRDDVGADKKITALSDG